MGAGGAEGIPQNYWEESGSSGVGGGKLSWLRIHLQSGSEYFNTTPAPCPEISPGTRHGAWLCRGLRGSHQALDTGWTNTFVPPAFCLTYFVLGARQGVSQLGGAFGMQLRGASGMQLRRASTLCLLTSRSRFLTPCPRQGFSLELPVSSLICGSTLCTFQIGTCAHCHSPSWHQAEGSSCTLAEPAYIWPEGASTSLMLHSVTGLEQWALAKGWPAFKCTGRA